MEHNRIRKYVLSVPRFEPGSIVVIIVVETIGTDSNQFYTKSLLTDGNKKDDFLMIFLCNIFHPHVNGLLQAKINLNNLC
jgi:hypothetical protein